MRGDFTGFQFGNYHTKDLGIVRVSGGDRYEEQLHPEIKDITAEVPGMDGQYFFGSTYGTKTFDLELAFDSLTEVQFRQLRQAFGTRKIEKLIFDEEPYKYYLAKLESPIELSYVCFDEPKRRIVGTEENDKRYGVRVVNRIPITEVIVDEDTQEEIEVETGEYELQYQRIYPYEQLEGTQCIYKGEGKITLICNYPFAKSAYKQLPQGKESEDWAVSSGILSADDYQQFDTYNNGTIKVYNPGDLATGFRLYLPSAAIGTDLKIEYIQTIPVENDEPIEEKIAEFNLSAITQMKTGDNGILIDTNNQLIIGVTSIDNDQINTSGNLYNEYLTSGYLFKITPMDILDTNYSLKINSNNQNIKIFYDYLYF